MVTSLQNYTRVCRTDVLPARGKKTLHIGDKTVLVVCDGDDIYAIDEAHGELWHGITYGKVMNGVITLRNSGARYDLKTGRYLGNAFSPSHHRLRVLETRVVDGQLYLRL